MKHIRLVAAVMLCVILLSNIAEARYYFSESHKDTPQDFTDFLSDCTDEERVQLLQALKELPALKDNYFGKLKGLPEISHFAKNRKSATVERPPKPATFNEVLPVTVIDASDKGLMTVPITPAQIRRGLVYRAYNKLTYPGRGTQDVDYHEIVQWAAEKAGVSKEQVKSLPTFALETKIAEKYFESIWDNLTHEQRVEFLKGIEKESGAKIDAETISRMGGIAALAAIQTAITVWGLPTILATSFAVLADLLSNSVILIATAKFLGTALGTVFSPLGWFLTSPIGWGVTVILAGSGLYQLGSAEKETVSAFILTVNMIKARKYVK
ncbi:MAG: hypothetical protein IJG37_11095 [Synergistaceae bacterium]|nr:hypothetical protein [Synergistaceae bacterium]MBQ7168826.1 hypothetical protein [Synergistaceae bacterium]